MASSGQLADALRNAERYSQVMNEGVRLRFDLDDRTATIVLDYHNVDRDTDRHQVEFWLVTLVRICRRVTDGRLAPSRLRIKHSRHGPPAEFRAFFGIDVEFDADADAICFPLQTALLPVVGRDGRLNELLRRYAEEAMKSKPRERPTVRSRVEEILPVLLPHGYRRGTGSGAAARDEPAKPVAQTSRGRYFLCGNPRPAAGRAPQALSRR